MANSYFVSIFTVPVLLLILGGSFYAQLSTSFYSKSCLYVFETVKFVVELVIMKERRIGASILRLHFHDCFVNGCDASVLLDDTPNFTGEKTATPNNNSIRGFNVVDDIKFALEKVCPEVVSCADILAITARDSTVILGGSSWDVKLRRKDARTASKSSAKRSIPPPISSLKALIKSFKAQGLSVEDMVTLSGSHTIGQSRCTNFRVHIYKGSNIDSSFAKLRKENCLSTKDSGDNNLAPLDHQTPVTFKNNYYKNLIEKKGLLHSDQELFNGGSTDSQVRKYIENPGAFSANFAVAMIKMGDIMPLTGSKGEIRKKCRMIN